MLELETLTRELNRTERNMYEGHFNHILLKYDELLRLLSNLPRQEGEGNRQDDREMNEEMRKLENEFERVCQEYDYVR